MHKQARRRAIVVSTVVALVLGTMTMAWAAPEKKSFTTGISPDQALAGTGGIFDLEITNTSDSAPLGAAQITIPGGFALDGTPGVPSGWSVTLISGDVVQVVADSVDTRLAPGGSLTVSLDLEVALNDAGTDQSYPFLVEARQANNFNGNRNDLNPPPEPAEVMVTGTAEPCEQGQSCQVSFNSGRVTADVSTVCVSSECGNLILDLDDSYCDTGRPCAGEGVFWIPPAVDLGQTVQLTLLVPRSEFDHPAPGQIAFFIAPTGAGEAVECGSASDTTECSYKVFPSGANFEIRVTLDQVDPRGFVS